MLATMSAERDYSERAREAIEIVCAGDLSQMEDYYHPGLVDHVNEMTFHGYDGGRESVAFYVDLFDNLRMGVDEQVAQDDRVASRWSLQGDYRGRPVTLRGITISRFAQDGRIVEDRGHTDSIALIRQLGAVRTFVLGVEILTRRVRLPKGALGANHAGVRPR
jgi:predicted ester cyclase